MIKYAIRVVVEVVPQTSVVTQPAPQQMQQYQYGTGQTVPYYVPQASYTQTQPAVYCEIAVGSSWNGSQMVSYQKFGPQTGTVKEIRINGEFVEVDIQLPATNDVETVLFYGKPFYATLERVQHIPYVQPLDIYEEEVADMILAAPARKPKANAKKQTNIIGNEILDKVRMLEEEIDPQDIPF